MTPRPEPAGGGAHPACSVRFRAAAREVGADRCDVRAAQLLRDRNHELAGVVLASARLPGFDLIGEVLGRLSRQIRRRMRQAAAVRTVAVVAGLNTLGLVALKSQLPAAHQLLRAGLHGFHGRRRRQRRVVRAEFARSEPLRPLAKLRMITLSRLWFS